MALINGNVQVGQSFFTRQTNSRKFVVTSNGNLFAAIHSNVVSPRRWEIRRSMDKGATWETIQTVTVGNAVLDIAITTDGTNIYVAVSFTDGNGYYVKFQKLSNTGGLLKDEIVNINNVATNMTEISIAIDKITKRIHIAYNAVTTQYPASNIVHAYSDNDGQNWTLTMITNASTASSQANQMPVIVAHNNHARIFYQVWNGSQYALHNRVLNGATGTWSAAFQLDNGLTNIAMAPNALITDDGVVHLTYAKALSNDSKQWYIYYRKTNGGTGNADWASTPDLVTFSGLTSLTNYQGAMTPQVVVDKTGAAFILFTVTVNSVVYLFVYYKKTPDAAFSRIDYYQANAQYAHLLYDPLFKTEYVEATPPLIYESVNSAVTGYKGDFIVPNEEPIVNLASPTNNRTLYENDILNITGTALDADNGNTVTVRYQINALGVRPIKAYLSDGSTLESFSKSLTFKNGNLYDGTTLIVGNLVDGVAHTLKVWATDDQGGTSSVIERAFYVVPNRAPGLTVTPPTIEGLINSDTFTIEGSYEDLDGNNTIVSYRLNGTSSVQITEGTGGPFSFELTFGALKDGENTIVIDAIDSYNAKTTKTVRLQKNRIETPLLRGVQRYKLNPAAGSASELLLWLRKLSALDVDVSISLGMNGEPENFIPLTATESVQIEGTNMTEDEFYIQADDAKDNIMIQFDATRASAEVVAYIESIKGVIK